MNWCITYRCHRCRRVLQMPSARPGDLLLVGRAWCSRCVAYVAGFEAVAESHPVAQPAQELRKSMKNEHVAWEANHGFGIVVAADARDLPVLQLARATVGPPLLFWPLPVPSDGRRHELTGIYVRLEYADERPAIAKPDPDPLLRVEEPLGIPELREALREFHDARHVGNGLRFMWPLVEAARLACGEVADHAVAPPSSADGAPPLAIGAVVQLKSGGPAMTVKSIDEAGHTVCQWLTCGGNRVEEQRFHRDMLELVVAVHRPPNDEPARVR